MVDLETAEEPDLREYLHILVRRKLTVVLTTLVVLGLALGYSYVKTPVYAATATVLVPQQQPSSALNVSNSQLQDPSALQRQLSDEQQFAQGDAVKAAASKLLGFSAKVAIGSSTTADVLTFKASSTSKVTAAAIANAYAHAYIKAHRANQVGQYTQQITALQSSIATLRAKQAALAPSDPQYAVLQQSVDTLTQSVEQTQAEMQVASQVGPSIVDAATVPKSPSSPKPLRNAVIGLFVGLILGIGVALLRERLDDGISSRAVAERAAGGRPILGMIPVVEAWRAKGAHHLALAEDPRSNAAEAYRTLRTAAQFVSIDKPIKTIAVTSSRPGEGKTTVTANLAVAFARAGQRVVVLSADLRRPRIHEFFGVSNRVGLTSVLLGTVPMSEAVLPVEGEDGLSIVPAGPLPPNPAEILALNGVVDVVESLMQRADVVLIDCPPVLPVADALLLSRLADGVLVLASTRSTSRRELARTFEMLDQVDAPTVGLVLNQVPTSGSGYDYGYGYGYYSSDDSDSMPSRRSHVSSNGSRIHLGAGGDQVHSGLGRRMSPVTRAGGE